MAEKHFKDRRDYGLFKPILFFSLELFLMAEILFAVFVISNGIEYLISPLILIYLLSSSLPRFIKTVKRNKYNQHQRKKGLAHL